MGLYGSVLISVTNVYSPTILVLRVSGSGNFQRKEFFNKIFNKIAIQARAQTAADKEAVGLSRIHMYKSKCIYISYVYITLERPLMVGCDT